MRNCPAVGCSTRKQGTGTHVHLLLGVEQPEPARGGQRPRRALEEARLGEHLRRAHGRDGHARAVAAAGQRQARAFGMDGRAMHRRVAPRMVPRACCAPGCSRGSSSPPPAAPPTWRRRARRWARPPWRSAADLDDEDAVIAAAAALGPWAPSSATPRRRSPPPEAGWRASAPASTARGTRPGPWPTRSGSRATAASSCSSARAPATARTPARSAPHWRTRRARCRSSGPATRSAPRPSCPGDATTDDDVAQLIAYLASPAGDYFSGCAFTLGATTASLRRPTIRGGRNGGTVRERRS